MTDVRDGWKNFAMSAYCGLGLCRLVLGMEGLRGQSIRIITYHRILDIPDRDSFPFDPTLIDAGVDQFRQQMRCISQDYDLITFDDVIRHLDVGEGLPKRPLLVTFDDGYDDIYKYAYPVLRDMNIAATLLLTTGYIGGTETFWYDWLAFIMLNTQADAIEVGDAREKLALGRSRAERMTALQHLMRRIGGMQNEARERFLQDVERGYGSVYSRQTDDIKALSRPLSWDQVREMCGGGMRIGSHTVTHPFLSKVDSERLYRELVDSKKHIEQETGLKASVLAYPNGQPDDYNASVRRAVRDAGYELALSYTNGVNRIGNIDRFAMNRLHVPMNGGTDRFRILLSSAAAIWKH